MKCPNCGAAEQAQMHRCHMCGVAYAVEDLLEVSQLEFLLNETAAWPEAHVRSKPYADRLAVLKARLVPSPPTPAAVEAQALKVVPKPVVPPPEPKVEPAPIRPEPKVQPVPVRPAPEPIPFDQWLLSERNIKIALYTGAALLVLAGLIFVAVNWARISGPAKFAITLTVTGLMYLGGYLLFQRPTLRLGGVALLGVASGFVPLNFVVLQIYVFSERGLNANVMWFIGSFPTLLLYILTAYWTRADLFTHLSLGAVASALTAALVLLGAPLLVFVLAYTLLLIVLLLCARAFQPTRLASFTCTPILIASQIAMPVLFLVSAALWLITTRCAVCSYGSPWLALTAMFGGVIFYVITDMVFRSFIAQWAATFAARWVAAFTFAVTFLFVLVQLRFSDTAIGLSLKVLALAYLLVGYTLERRSGKPAAWPLYIAGYAAAAFVTLQALTAFGENPADLANALIGDAILLAVSARVHRQYEWLYGAAWVFIAPIFIYSGMYLQGLSNQAVRLILVLAYLLAGYVLERRLGRRDVWLYAAGYAVAAFVTLQALAAFRQDPAGLANALIGNVILLGVATWVHRQYELIYGAAWLFITPVFIYASLHVRGYSNHGIVLSVLMLIYVAAGYALGRRALRLGGPFLTAAAFLSVIVGLLTWSNAGVASIALGLIAVLYLFAALWLRWSWLLLPALVAAHVVVVATLRVFFAADSPWAHALTIIYATLGVALTLGGARLRRAGQEAWGWPLYLVAALDIAGSYTAGLLLSGPIVIGLSAVFAMLALSLAWVEREAFANAKLPPLLTYLGAMFVFVGHFYVIGLLGGTRQVWPAFTAGLCALFVALAWLLRHEPVRDIYGTPLHWAGLGLMLVPLGGAVSIFDPLLIAVSFAIAGIAYAFDAVVRRNRLLGYLAGSAFLVAMWAVLRRSHVEELQAYVIPLGTGLLALGWNERRLGDQVSYRWSTLLGLLILMGSAFYQSLNAVIYAMLLLVESLGAVAWGVHIRSRRYVQLGVLSLVANAIAQLGPAFVEWPRWIQLAVVGGILLGGGLVALFRREQLLAARKRLTDEWRRWAP